jgi:hypothetical protein
MPLSFTPTFPEKREMKCPGGLSATYGDNHNPFICEPSAQAFREGLDRDLIADALDQNDRPSVVDPGEG